MDNSKIVFHSLEEVVQAAFGESAVILRSDSIPGGDINDAYRVTLSDGKKIFVKMNLTGNLNFFLTEAGGLEALGSSGKIKVPEVLGYGIDERRGCSFLAMEYIESAPRTEAYWERFGHQLAELHRAECGLFVDPKDAKQKYGFSEDNYIGAGPQKNDPSERWIEFYRECRLLPQIRRAERYLDLSVRRKADRLLDHLDSYLREPEFPSLLHGDLWSGNMMCGPGGSAWIIDPAAYVGDFEADLAMTQLFGSLPGTFYSAYSEINPIDREGYPERRKLYDLYHLLNHLNLFGAGYLGSVVEIINRFAG